ncbi:MAG: hypothetical protein GXC73_14780 [Chitinophagaceae bacterium]|nr:hypothetical protein [Chitinophagaceae bacterium]
MQVVARGVCCFMAVVFATADIKAQVEVKEPFVQQFADYTSSVLQEKMFMHSDKNIYLAGEICWFKLYTVDASSHTPVDVSKVAYIEMLDKSNRPVLQTKLELKKGFGNGSVQLPVTLASGKYKLRAYTAWMKNFSADYFFEKVITIVNTQRTAEADVVETENKYDLQLFPEGGNLVADIESKVAVRFVDKNGIGINTKGYVVGNSNDTILQFSTTRFGIGNFILKPIAGITYKAVIETKTGIVSQSLPSVYSKGYSLQLVNSGTSYLKAVVRTKGIDFDQNIVYLFAHTRGSVKLAKTGNIQNGRFEFLIEKDKLGEGVVHFTLLDAFRKPLCERLYFLYPNDGSEVNISSDSVEYGIREKVTVNIDVVSKQDKKAAANTSMAVYLLDSLQTFDVSNIATYLLLSSDLAGTIESPEYYFNQKGAEVEETMDNLMLTHGWRRFNWENISTNAQPVFKYLPEYKGHILTGTVGKLGTAIPGANLPVYLSFAGKRAQVKTTLSDAAGKIKFNIADFHNNGEIIVQTNSAKDSLFNVAIDNPFSSSYSERNLPPFSINYLSRYALQRHHVSVQVQSNYNTEWISQFKSPADTGVFYFKPDVSYLLDNYVRFTTMEEVLIEYVREVKLKKANGSFRVSVFDNGQKMFFEEDPLLLLDGVPVFKTDKIMAYSPLNIEKLEVVSRKYYRGEMTYNGIINMVTYKGNLKDYELDPNATVIDYEGLQLQREFFSPVYEIKDQYESRIPDFRNVLYWNPEVVINSKEKKSVSFYTSDLPGRYVVVLQGISENGDTVNKVLHFQVK